MASSFEKSVKGGTKIKLAAPKSKYVEHILIATHAGEAGVAEIFRALQNRLRDSTWTIVFKSLIIIHLMIREGEPDVTLKYLSHQPTRKLAINNFTEVQTQGRNIRTYSEYLLSRAKGYAATRVDYVRNGENRLKRLTVEKGLLRETEVVQSQIRALLECDFLTNEPENEITLTAFRLLTMDLLTLFYVMNEGTINVLEHYFEMSHPDAERALNIYKTFVRQTDQVVQYLSVARLHEHSTRLEIPKIKHAPLSLAKSLEDYLNDKDFEINRRQYLAQQEAKKNKLNGNKNVETKKVASPKASPASPASPQQSQQPKGPAPDLIDFFESIEQNQQPMAQQQATATAFPGQNTGFAPQQAISTGMPQTGQATNPFGQIPQQPVQPVQPVQPNFTGAGFGGYTPAPQQQPTFNPHSTPLPSIPQNGIPSYSPQQPQQPQFTGVQTQQLQPQSTNPFRQSMLPPVSGSPTQSSLQRASTNPFAKHTTGQTSSSPFSQTPSISTPPQTQQPFSPPQQPTLQPAPTGSTNPFTRQASPNNHQQQSSSPFSPPGGGGGGGGGAGGLMPTPTGSSTNPFRQSQFVNQQTGQGWQNSQGTMGGLEQLETLPVFPRIGGGGQALPQLQQQGQMQQGQMPQQQQTGMGWM